MEFFTPGHLIVLAIVVAILFFGWKQLPDMSRSLGRSLRILKTEVKGMTDDDQARESAKSADAGEPKAIEAPQQQPAATQRTQQAAEPAPVVTPRSMAAPRPSAAAGRPRPNPRPNANGARANSN